MPDTSQLPSLLYETAIPEGGVASPMQYVSNDVKTKAKQTAYSDNYMNFMSSQQPNSLDALKDNRIKLKEYNVGLEDVYAETSNGEFINKYENFRVGTNNEERLAQKQSTSEKWINGIEKFVGKTGVAVLGGTLGVADSLVEGIAKGSLSEAYNTNFNKYLDDLNIQLDYKLPNYYTEQEKNASLFGQVGTANFWVDKVFGGLSFTAGALISEGIWGAATGGAGLLASESQLARLAKWTMKGVGGEAKMTEAMLAAKTMAKGSATGLLEAESTAVGRKLANETLETIATTDKNLAINAYKIRKAADVALVMTRSAGYESGMEARQYMNSTEHDWLENYQKQNGRMPSAEEQADFKDGLTTSANYVFGANMIIVGSSNIAQFGNAIMGKSVNPIIGNNFLKRSLFGIGFDKTVTEEGKILYKALEATKGQKIAGKLWGVLGAAIPEAQEEMGQRVASETAHNYMMAAFDPQKIKTTYGVADAFTEALKNTYGTKEGLSEGLVGAIVGILGAGVHSRFKFGELSQEREEIEKGAEYANAFTADNHMNNVIANNKIQLAQENKQKAIQNGDITGEILSDTASAIQLMDRAQVTGSVQESYHDFARQMNAVKNDELAKDLGLGTGEEAEKQAQAFKEQKIAEYKELSENHVKNLNYAQALLGETEIAGLDKTSTREVVRAMAFNMTMGEKAMQINQNLVSHTKNLLAESFNSDAINSALDVQQILDLAPKEKTLKLSQLDLHLQSLDRREKDILNRQIDASKLTDTEDNKARANALLDIQKELSDVQAERETVTKERQLALDAIGIKNYVDNNITVDQFAAQNENLAKLKSTIEELKLTQPEKYFELQKTLQAHSKSIEHIKNYQLTTQAIVNPNTRVKVINGWVSSLLNKNTKLNEGTAAYFTEVLSTWTRDTAVAFQENKNVKNRTAFKNGEAVEEDYKQQLGDSVRRGEQLHPIDQQIYDANQKEIEYNAKATIETKTENDIILEQISDLEKERDNKIKEIKQNKKSILSKESRIREIERRRQGDLSTVRNRKKVNKEHLKIELDVRNIYEDKEYTPSEIGNILNRLRAKPEIIKVFNDIFEASNKLNVKVIFTNDYNKYPNLNSNDPAAGYYKLGTHSTIIDSRYFLENIDFVPEVIVHEMVHAVTVYAVEAVENNKTDLLTESQIKAVQNLKDILTELKKDSEFTNLYGSKNIKELLSALTNTEYVNKLKNKKWKGNESKSFFDRIVESIVSLFKKDANAYDTVYKQLEGIITDPNMEALKENTFTSVDDSNVDVVSKKVEDINKKYDDEIKRIQEEDTSSVGEDSEESIKNFYDTQISNLRSKLIKEAGLTTLEQLKKKVSDIISSNEYLTKYYGTDLAEQNKTKPSDSDVKEYEELLSKIDRRVEPNTSKILSRPSGFYKNLGLTTSEVDRLKELQTKLNDWLTLEGVVSQDNQSVAEMLDLIDSLQTQAVAETTKTELADKDYKNLVEATEENSNALGNTVRGLSTPTNALVTIKGDNLRFSHIKVETLASFFPNSILSVNMNKTFEIDLNNGQKLVGKINNRGGQDIKLKDWNSIKDQSVVLIKSFGTLASSITKLIGQDSQGNGIYQAVSSDFDFAQTDGTNLEVDQQAVNSTKNGETLDLVVSSTDLYNSTLSKEDLPDLIHIYVMKAGKLLGSLPATEHKENPNGFGMTLKEIRNFAAEFTKGKKGFIKLPQKVEAKISFIGAPNIEIKKRDDNVVTNNMAFTKESVQPVVGQGFIENGKVTSTVKIDVNQFINKISGVNKDTKVPFVIFNYNNKTIAFPVNFNSFTSDKSQSVLEVFNNPETTTAVKAQTLINALLQNGLDAKSYGIDFSDKENWITSPETEKALNDLSQVKETVNIERFASKNYDKNRLVEDATIAIKLDGTPFQSNKIMLSASKDIDKDVLGYREFLDKAEIRETEIRKELNNVTKSLHTAYSRDHELDNNFTQTFDDNPFIEGDSDIVMRQNINTLATAIKGASAKTKKVIGVDLFIKANTLLKELNSISARIKDIKQQIKESEYYQDSPYVTVNEKNQLDNPLINEADAIQELGGIKNYEEYQDALNASDLEYLKTQESQFDEMSQFNKFPQKEILNGELVDKVDTSLEDTLSATLVEPENKVLENSLSNLEGILPSVWNNSPESIKILLKDVEKQAIDANVDLTGLSESYDVKSQDEILDLTRALDFMLKHPTQQTVEHFINTYKNFIGKVYENITKVTKVAEKFRDKPLIGLDTKDSEYKLFKEQGLLEIQDGVYLKTDGHEKTLEEVENLMLTNLNVFPESTIKGDINNEQIVKEDLNSFVESQIGNILTNDAESDLDTIKKMVYYKTYFGIKDVVKPTHSAQKLASITGLNIENERYLKADFIGDMRNKQLRKEHPVLENLVFDQRGITLKYTDNLSLEQMENYLTDNEDLRNYFLISKNSNFSPQIEENEDALTAQEQRNYFANGGHLENYKDNYTRINTETVETTTTDDFISINGDTYERTYNNLFSKLQKTDEDFYESNIESPILNVDPANYRQVSAETKIETNNLLTRQEEKDFDENLDCSK